MVRLLGERLQHTGVVAGMSGSPVYVDGRLVGAIAYRVGNFVKEPLAGITPIEKMLPVLELPSRGAAAPRPAAVDPLRWSLPLLPEDSVAVVEFLPRAQEDLSLAASDAGARALGVIPLPGGAAAGWDPLALVRSGEGPALLWPAPGSLRAPLRPIETPLLFSGVDPVVLGAYSGRLRELGLLPVQGGGAGRLPAGAPKPTRFEPGSAIAAQLARGDVDISATGTLTYLADGEVLAFGHAFLRTGSTAIPFAPARVLMTVPSLDDSFKLAAPGDSLGLLWQDRLTAVAGRIGESAPMIPVRLSVRTAGAPARDLAFDVLEDPLWGPLVMEIAIAGSLVNAIDFSLPATVEMRATFRFDGYPELRIGNLFAAPGGPLIAQQVATRYLASLFSLLYANRFETPRVRGLEVQIEQRPDRLFTVVEDVWLSRGEAAPGEALNARVFLRPYRGPRTHRDFELRVPAGLPEGTIRVQVAGGHAFLRRDQRVLQQRLTQSEGLDQMMQVVADLPRFDSLYLRLVRRSDGGILKQRLAPALPPSVLEVLRSSETSGDFTPLREEVLVEERVDLRGAVFGGREAVLRVRAR